LSPKRFVREARREITSLRRLMTGLPARIDDLLQLVESGELKLIIELAGLDEYIRWIIKTINRVAAALIIAAIFLGSALILRSPTGPQWLGIPAFAFIGLVVSGILGIWFFFALIRSGAL
jgi:ubiquinone biosynthesis protein